MIQRVFFGPKNERWAALPDANNWWEQRADGGARRRHHRRRHLSVRCMVDVLEQGIINIVKVLS